MTSSNSLLQRLGSQNPILPGGYSDLVDTWMTTWHDDSNRPGDSYTPAVFTLPAFSVTVPSSKEATSVRINSALEIKPPQLLITRLVGGSDALFPVAGTNAWHRVSLYDAYMGVHSNITNLQTYRVDSDGILHGSKETATSSDVGAPPPILQSPVTGQDVITFPTNVQMHTSNDSSTIVGTCRHDERFLLACVSTSAQDRVLSPSLATRQSAPTSFISENGCGSIRGPSEGSVLLLYYRNLADLRDIFPHWFDTNQKLRAYGAYATKDAFNANELPFIVDYTDRAHNSDPDMYRQYDNDTNRPSPRAHDDGVSYQVAVTEMLKKVSPYAYANEQATGAHKTTYSMSATGDSENLNVTMSHKNPLNGQKKAHSITSQDATAKDCEFAFVFSLPATLTDPTVDTSYSSAFQLETSVMVESGVFMSIDGGDRRSGKLHHRRAMLQTEGSDDVQTFASTRLVLDRSNTIDVSQCPNATEGHLKVEVDGQVHVKCVDNVGHVSLSPVNGGTKQKVENTQDDVRRNTILMIVLISIAGIILVAVSMMAFMQYKTHRMTWELNTMLSGSPMTRRPQREASAAPTNQVVERAIGGSRFM